MDTAQQSASHDTDESKTRPVLRLKMGETNVRNDELSQLQAEVEEEREFKDMLQDSVSDLRSTLADLEKRLHSVDGEENEWRTRYETQLELNEQLEKQITVVRERLETLRSDPADRLASIRSYDEMSEDALRQRLKLLSTEKSGLQSQLMDFQMRIVQEGKTYQKVYEERWAYLTEIAKLSSTVDMSRKQQMVLARRTALGSDKTRGQEDMMQHSNMMKVSVKKTPARSRLPQLKH
ncbi:coiled-coil domain containing 169 [Rhinichthys klamathensis goyatoka]|uniref:coiled-coil domain containing 169 n=1 Tax=Rhinichthys klamathensis goyatoka TaxID=3034132 RepID=UPI0024B48F1A|nr:coiled-coil domain containing 169 [Rhinichthys klamathensis goyatoka]